MSDEKPLQGSPEEDDMIFQDQGCLDLPLQVEEPDDEESESEDSDEDSAS